MNDFMKTITKEQARRFILLKQGLIGSYRYVGKDGAYEFIREAGCIQYDPVDVCGKNAELTLQSRVKGFTKKNLQDLLYKDRLLVDYADKELSIWPSEDWPYFSFYRERSRQMGEAFELKQFHILKKMGLSVAIHFLLKVKYSGILQCIGAVIGIKNLLQPDRF